MVVVVDVSAGLRPAHATSAWQRRAHPWPQLAAVDPAPCRRQHVFRVCGERGEEQAPAPMFHACVLRSHANAAELHIAYCSIAAEGDARGGHCQAGAARQHQRDGWGCGAAARGGVWSLSMVQAHWRLSAHQADPSRVCNGLHACSAPASGSLELAAMVGRHGVANGTMLVL